MIYYFIANLTEMDLSKEITIFENLVLKSVPKSNLHYKEHNKAIFSRIKGLFFSK